MSTPQGKVLEKRELFDKRDWGFAECLPKSWCLKKQAEAGEAEPKGFEGTSVNLKWFLHPPEWRGPHQARGTGESVHRHLASVAGEN